MGVLYQYHNKIQFYTAQKWLFFQREVFVKEILDLMYEKPVTGPMILDPSLMFCDMECFEHIL